MTVTSLSFLGFLLCGMILYYMIPKGQWIILLALSIFYYVCAAVPYTILYLLASAVSAYIAGLLAAPSQEQSSNETSGTAGVLIVTIAILFNVLLWFVFKFSGWMPFAAAIGMGYYTAQVIGYILDCYRGIIVPQRNILKLFLFVAFFPQLTVGPISRYSQLEELYTRHHFSYQNLAFGSQRILWGFYKKMVISDRVGIFIDAIWANTAVYIGVWPWLAVLLYPLQIYTDFSGCMDIVLGAAELFDLHLPENFRNPFFSRTCQEFWQRWHITLGSWARDYVYYPLLKSRFLQGIGRWAKKHFKRRTAKLIPWLIGMAILWFVMGFWHGSIQHIVGVGLWFWTILAVGEIGKPLFERMKKWFRIDENSFGWHLFQSIRTYLLYAFGVVFFSADNLKVACEHYRVLAGTIFEWNPWILFNGHLMDPGSVSWRDLNLVIFGVVCLFVVAILRERHGYARIWIQKQILLPFRWLLWLGMLTIILLYGQYGFGYDAASFIYGAF